MVMVMAFVEQLGPLCVRVALAPVGLAVPFTDAVLHDPLDPDVDYEGALVLGIGLGADAAALGRVLKARPAAVALKQEGPVDDVTLTAAANAGVAVLIVSGGVSWARVTELALALSVDDMDVDLDAEPSGSGPSELLQELFDVANVIAARVRAPITIEDTQSRLLAYSAQDSAADVARAATILGHRVPDAYRAEVRRLGIAKRLLTETTPIQVSSDLPGVSPRLVMALRARGQLLGSMWAIVDGPVDEATAQAFERAAHDVSLRIWRHRVAADLQREQRSATVRLVLAGGPAATAVGRGAGLESAGFRLLAASVRSSEGRWRSDLGRVRDVLSTQAVVAHPAALTAEVGDVVYAVLPCPAAAEASARVARDTAGRLRTALDDELRDRVVVARSGHCASLAEMHHAHSEVMAVLRVLADDERGRTDAELEDVGVEVVLHRLVDLQAGRPLLHTAVAAAITEHDARHGTDYWRTLGAHLWAFGDAAAAAHRLGVHTNTFRYRLRRLGELFDIDLDDPDVRFSLMLQLRLGET